MDRCSILGCKSDSEWKLPDLSFHSSPTNDNVRLQWVKATGRKNWTPKKSSRICSTHFEKNDLFKKNKLNILLPNAVPLLGCNINIPGPTTSSQVPESTEINNPKELQVTSTATEEAHESPHLNESATGKSPSYTPRTMRKKLHRTAKQSEDRLKKVRALREKSRRLTKKVANLTNVIAELKAKFLVSEEGGDLLESIDPEIRNFPEIKFFRNMYIIHPLDCV